MVSPGSERAAEDETSLASPLNTAYLLSRRWMDLLFDPSAENATLLGTNRLAELELIPFLVRRRPEISKKVDFTALHSYIDSDVMHAVP